MRRIEVAGACGVAPARQREAGQDAMLGAWRARGRRGCERAGRATHAWERRGGGGGVAVRKGGATGVGATRRAARACGLGRPSEIRTPWSEMKERRGLEEEDQRYFGPKIFRNTTKGYVVACFVEL